MKKLLIVADYNDADYSQNFVRMEDEKFERYLPLIKAINNFEPYISKGRCARVINHNWDSQKSDLERGRTKSIYEIYNQFDKQLIDDFIEDFFSGMVNPEADYGAVFHTIVSLEDVVNDVKYIEWNSQKAESRYNDKVKGFINRKTEIYSYVRESDGKPFSHIPFTEMNEYEKELMNELNTLWMKYQ